MSFWSSEILRKRLKDENIVSEFHEELLERASYHLRLGGEAYITRDSKDREAALQRGTTPGFMELDDRGTVSIPAGQFAYLLTEETLTIPDNALGFISIRAGRKFDGLINVSGFHIDPGYHGKLIFAVFNAGPQTIILERKEAIFLLFFSDLASEGNYHPPSAGKSLEPKIGYKAIPAQMMQKMSGAVPSLFKLSETSRDIEVRLAAVEGRLLLAAGTASIAIILALAVFGKAIVSGDKSPSPDQFANTSKQFQHEPSASSAPTQ